MTSKDYDRIWDYRINMNPSLLDAIKNDTKLSIRDFTTRDFKGLSVPNVKIEHISIDQYLLEKFNIFVVTYVLIGENPNNPDYEEPFETNDKGEAIEYARVNATTGQFIGEFGVPNWAITWF